MIVLTSRAILRSALKSENDAPMMGLTIVLSITACVHSGVSDISATIITHERTISCTGDLA